MKEISELLWKMTKYDAKKSIAEWNPDLSIATLQFFETPDNLNKK